MSIARMKKLSVIGHSSIKDELMKELMILGVVEISAQDDKLALDSEWKQLVSKDGNEGDVARYDSWINKVSQALEAIEKYQTGKNPLFRTRKPVKLSEFKKVLKKKQEIETKVDDVVALSNRIAQLNSTENKLETIRLSLLPWKEFDIPLEVSGTEKTDLLMGTVPAVADTELLKKELQEKVERTVVETVGKDAEQNYIYIICLKEDRLDVDDVLKSYGFNRAQFGDLKATTAENIAFYDAQISEVEKERERVIQSIREEEGQKENFQFVHDHLILKRNQSMIRSRLLITEQVFYLDGWLPYAAVDKVESLLSEKECYYELRDPEKEEETPVLLLNGRFNGPFESITKLYALPDSRGIDATPFFALSFAVFFGLMLSDAAYGLILTISTFIILKKFRLEGMASQMFRMFFYCGISTIFWGLMFGGFFGDLIAVFSKTFFNLDIEIPALWFSPMADPMKLLIFSFVLGGIHLFIGMGLNAYMMIRDGRPWDAVFDIGLWYILLIGLVLMLAGIATGLGKVMAIVGAVGILITGGRNNKGIGKITGGLGSLYGITGYLSDVLSYSRLLALGLATGVIASVVNTMGSLAGGGITGLILFIVAFAIGHSYNIAINALGSFVHSCRLEYVEFFGKFYVSGGEAFEPFNENTKYIEILREEN